MYKRGGRLQRLYNGIKVVFPLKNFYIVANGNHGATVIEQKCN